MAYYLDLFSPETYEAFTASDRTVSGFRTRHRAIAAKVKPGDLLLCYMTRVSRWIALLRVETPSFIDARPIFTLKEDPFVVRFRVTPLVCLQAEDGIPIHDDSVWKRLSITREHPMTSGRWTGLFRTSLNRLSEEDGRLLEELLTQQERSPKPYPLSPEDKKLLVPRVVRRAEGAITVTVPDDPAVIDEEPSKEARESIKVQALLARIGATMGLTVWLPANDRAAVVREWGGDAHSVVDALPLN